MEINEELKAKLKINEKEVELLAAPVAAGPSAARTVVFAILQLSVAAWLLSRGKDFDVVIGAMILAIAGYQARQDHYERENHRLYTLAREIIEFYRGQEQKK